MKIFYYIVLLLIFSPRLMAQEWKDSLREARQSYLDQKYEKSFRQYRSAQKVAPKEIDLSDEMAQSAYKAEKYEDAEKIFSKSSSNKGSAAQRAKIQRQIGNSKMHQKKYDEAIQSYKESLRINPEDERSRYNLTEALRKQKEEQEKKDKQNKDNKSKDQKDQDGKKDDQQNQPQPKEGEQKDQQQNSDSKPQNGKQGEDKKPQLSDKKTERTLDDLMKKEMETKKKFQGVKSTAEGTKGSGKDW